MGAIQMVALHYTPLPRPLSTGEGLGERSYEKR